jgi:hypothetical protein
LALSSYVPRSFVWIFQNPLRTHRKTSACAPFRDDVSSVLAALYPYGSDSHPADDLEPLGGQTRPQGGDDLTSDALEQNETFVGWPEEDELADADLSEPPNDLFHRVG